MSEAEEALFLLAMVEHAESLVARFNDQVEFEIEGRTAPKKRRPALPEADQP